MEIALSVLIPTYGRPRELEATVKCLLPQLQSGDEIIVVTQDEDGIIKREDWPPDGPIRCLRSSPPGLTRARNLGILQSRNPFGIFLDDDIIPAPDLLSRFRLAIASRPNAVWTGKIIQTDRPREATLADRTSPFPGYVDLKSGTIVTDYGDPPPGPMPFFAGGLCSLPLHKLGHYPWYSPRFRGSALGEEIDLALRLRTLGIEILCDPTISMIHLKAPHGGCRSVDYQRRSADDEAFNRAYFWGLHGEYRGLPAFARRMRSFLEFHARQKAPRWLRHHPRIVLKMSLLVLWGFGSGCIDRWGRKFFPAGDLIKPGRESQ